MKMSEIKDYQKYVGFLNKNTLTEWVLVTPEIAGKMLEANTANYRKSSPSTILKYRKDIENGDWEINGDTIVFDTEGVLKNGKHRLMAVVESKKPIISLVVYEIELDGQVFASKAEAMRYWELKLMVTAHEIYDLNTQVKFELIPKQYKSNGRAERSVDYIADFTYLLPSGEFVVEDVKGARTPEYVIKRKLMLQVHGIEIREVRL